MKYIFVLLTGFSLLLVGCGSEDHDHDDGIAYWTCPMHPEVKESEQTPCPLCGMDLTPVYADHDDHDDPAPRGRLRIDPVQRQLIGMQFDTVQTRHLKADIRTIGEIVPDERRYAEVTLRVMGYVEKTHVNETGVTVRRGQPLVTVYSPDLVSSQEDYLIALKRGNENLANRARERLRLLNMPESEILRLEENGEVLLEVMLTAPSTGVVMKNNARDGMQIMPGMMLYEIVDLSNVWLIASVYEDDLPFIYEGQNVQFEIQGLSNDLLSGKVNFIPPMVDRMTRTVPVRINVPNNHGRVKVDQYGWVFFERDLGEELSVHRDAILMTGRGEFVFKEIETGRFSPVEVHLGPRAGEYFKVLHGLDEGDRVVTSGRFFLDADARLRGIGAEAAAPAHQHE